MIKTQKNREALFINISFVQFHSQDPILDLLSSNSDNEVVHLQQNDVRPRYINQTATVATTCTCEGVPSTETTASATFSGYKPGISWKAVPLKFLNSSVQTTPGLTLCVFPRRQDRFIDSCIHLHATYRYFYLAAAIDQFLSCDRGEGRYRVFGGAIDAESVEIRHHLPGDAVDVNYVAVDAEGFHRSDGFFRAEQRR